MQIFEIQHPGVGVRVSHLEATGDKERDTENICRVIARMASSSPIINEDDIVLSVKLQHDGPTASLFEVSVRERYPADDEDETLVEGDIYFLVFAVFLLSVEKAR